MSPVFAELCPGLRPGIKDGPTLTLPHVTPLCKPFPYFSRLAHPLLTFDVGVWSLPPGSLPSSLLSVSVLVFYREASWFLRQAIPVYESPWEKGSQSTVGWASFFLLFLGVAVCLTPPVSNLQDGDENPLPHKTHFRSYPATHCRDRKTELDEAEFPSRTRCTP